jgi:hypothetical protein
VQLVVGLETAHRQHILEHRAELRLAPAAARLHVAEQTLDVADLRRHRLDIAERLLHGRELIDDAREALLHLLLDRGMKLLVYHRLHLGEPLLVAFPQHRELRIERGADPPLLLRGRGAHGVHGRRDGRRRSRDLLEGAGQRPRGAGLNGGGEAALGRRQLRARGVGLGAEACQQLLVLQAQTLGGAVTLARPAARDDDGNQSEHEREEAGQQGKKKVGRHTKTTMKVFWFFSEKNRKHFFL